MEGRQETVEYVEHTRLRRHPSNVRRVYPSADVMAMVESFRSRMERGEPAVIEPLIAVREGEGGVVVAGNMRLTAACVMGDAAPLMPVIYRDMDGVEQLLVQSTENDVRSAPDPISRALHYRALLEQPGMTLIRLARESGRAPGTIRTCLLMLDLEPEIQELIAARKLPRTREPIEALLSIPDSAARVRTAVRLAERRASRDTVVETCRRVVVGLAESIGVERCLEAVRPDQLGLREEVCNLLREGQLPMDPRVVKALAAIRSAPLQAAVANALAEEGANVACVEEACALARRGLQTKVRELVGSGALPAKVPALQALAAIADPAVQAETARLLAARGADVDQVVAACERLGGRASGGSGGNGSDGRVAVDGERPVPWTTISDVIAACCTACDQPLWEQVERAVDGTCGTCEARRLPAVCQGCALVAFVHRLAREAGAGQEDAGEHALPEQAPALAQGGGRT